MAVGDHSIGGVPIGASSSGTGSPGPPSPGPPGGLGFPFFNFDQSAVKVRFLEPNAPEGIAVRWQAMPRGVYLGFTPVTTPGSDELTLDVDAEHNFSLIKVGSSTQTAMVDIFTGSPVTLDFSGHTQFPVYVIAQGTFSPTVPAQGRIITRTFGSNSNSEVVICRINKVGGNLVAETTVPSLRQPPVAFSGQTVGFMGDNAIDELSDAAATVAEILTARTSVHTGAAVDLKSRIDADLIGSSMADRLSLRSVNTLGNIHPASGTSVNVSASFSETSRAFAPMLTISALGAESPAAEGAITDPSLGRNVCFVVNSISGERVIDATSREPIHGALTSTSGSIPGGREIVFTQALDTVSGINGPFQAPLEEGDLVLGADGLFYAVETILTPNSATLASAYQGASANVDGAAFRRFTLSFLEASGAPFNLVNSAGPVVSIQFSFPSFFRTDRAIFDASLFLKRNGERPALPPASTSEEGTFLLAVDNGLVGTVRTIKNGSTIIGNDYHTVNFVFGGAVAAPGQPGVANVSVAGPPGAPGPSQNQGPTGPIGLPGPGYSVNVPYDDSTGFNGSPAVAGPFSHTQSFGPSPMPNVVVAYGGWGGLDAAQTAIIRELFNVTIGPADTITIDADWANSFGGPLPGNNIATKLFVGGSQ